MNTNELLRITSILIVFVSFLLAFFLLTVKSKNKTGNNLLALYLLINAIDVSSFFYHKYLNVDPTIEMLRIEIGSFIKLPLLFLFVLTVIYSDFKLKSKHLLHLIPFLLSTMVLLPNFYLSNFQSKVLFFEDHAHTIEGTLSIILAHLQSIFYITVTFVILKKYKKILLENFSISTHFNYKWLLQMNIILATLFVVATIKNLYKYSDYSADISLYRLSTAIVILLFTCWLFLKALYAPKMFKGIDSQLQLVSTIIKNKDINKTYADNKENSEKTKIIFALKKHMIDNEPYLNPEFTIQDLANQLNINVRELSLIINHHLNQNFYEFTNKYRIHKAQEILKNPKHKKLTILEILYKIGFNSKSSFNKSFKEISGITPTEFRNKKL